MSLRPSSCLAIALLLIAVPASAQSPDDEVRAVIDQLFDGMRAGDSTAVRATFHPALTLQSVGIRDGATMMQEGSADQFVQAVGQPHEQVWDERIWDVVIHVDDPLATAWMNYAFYLGEELSHCGVNAFRFLRGADGWKILSIIDTRRREGCAPASDG